MFVNCGCCNCCEPSEWWPKFGPPVTVCKLWIAYLLYWLKSFIAKWAANNAKIHFKNLIPVQVQKVHKTQHDQNLKAALGSFFKCQWPKSDSKEKGKFQLPRNVSQSPQLDCPHIWCVPILLGITVPKNAHFSKNAGWFTTNIYYKMGIKHFKQSIDWFLLLVGHEAKSSNPFWVY